MLLIFEKEVKDVVYTMVAFTVFAVAFVGVDIVYSIVVGDYAMIIFAIAVILVPSLIASDFRWVGWLVGWVG